MTVQRSELLNLQTWIRDKYERLVFEKTAFQKQAHQNQQRYFELFGDQMIENYTAALELLEVRKRLTLTRRYINRGEVPDEEVIEEIVQQALKGQRKMLEDLSGQVNRAKNPHPVSREEKLLLRSTFRKLVRTIHPDINPVFSQDPVLKELWNEVMDAYSRNHLEDLKEAEIRIQKRCKELGLTVNVLEEEHYDPDCLEKVEADIEEILLSDAFQIGYWIDDEDLVNEEHKRLDEECRITKNYAKSLCSELKQLEKIPCQMN